ncbi:MAG: TIR domain-containing protein [Acidobacteria bacterium]|nr:TIR domain-containing protein [Acidobacteriota bacterium]
MSLAEARIQEARKNRATSLDLSNLDLTELPKSVTQLSQLGMLYLDRNQLTMLPESVLQLSKLWELSLSNNQLKMLPESVAQLSQLTTLYLDGNQLTTLPEALQKLTQLEQLYLHENEALGLPAEVLGPAWREHSAAPAKPAEILNYYFRTRGSEKRPLNEAKLILVGRGAVGKTSIVNRLIRNKFKNEKKTEGIKITGWPLKVGDAKDDVRLNGWDFGGQEIMHATHQFFLTERSLYLLVLSGREGVEDADAEYWLKLIQSFGGGDSPVVVVLNKTKEHPFDVNRNALQRKYPFIRDFVKTDCEDATGIEELRRLVERETDNLEHLRDAFPASWFTIKDKLAGMKRNYLSFEEYRHECASLGERDPQAQESLAFYLHSLGIALNYKDDTRLKDTHVLNPHWVTSGIYKILNANRLEKQKGEISLNDLPAILDAQDYPTEMHGFLLELMKKFELCFLLSDKEGVYLIPELLGKQEPDDASAFDPLECLNFEYQYPVLPEGLLPRFVVRTHVLSDDTPRWRTGVILKLEDNLALVRADAQERRVLINIKGPVANRRRLLSIIRANFDRIHDDIKHLKPAEIVPLPGRPGSHVPYKELLTLESKGKITFDKVVDENILSLDVQQLLNGVELEAERGHASDERGRMDIERKRAARIFVSYSHKDERLLNELKTHLSPLRRQKLIESWDDRDIEAGDDWREKINENLERADIIILLISSDFINSDYCIEKEMKLALARHEKKEARVVPVIVRDTKWELISELSKLQAIPKNGKAVRNWANKDTAWKDVSDRIEKMIKAMRDGDSLGRRAR